MDYSTWLVLGSMGLTILAMFLRQRERIKYLENELELTRSQLAREQKMLLELAELLHEEGADSD